MSWKILAPFNWIRESRLVAGPTRFISSVWNSQPVCWISRGYNAFCCYHLIESALSNTLVLNTYRHGTSLKNYVGITLRGLDPKKGGDPNAGGEASAIQANGGTSPYAANDQGYVYLGADTCQIGDSRHEDAVGLWFMCKYGTRIAFSLASNFAMLTPYIGDETKRRCAALLLTCFTPTIKAHFAPAESPEDYPTGIEEDNSMKDEAVRTKKHLGWNNLGISGSLWQGLKNPNLPKRTIRNPTRFCVGLMQATLAAGATAKLFGRPLPLPLPSIFHRLWEYRILRWPVEYGIRFSAW